MARLPADSVWTLTRRPWMPPCKPKKPSAKRRFYSMPLAIHTGFSTRNSRSQLPRKLPKYHEKLFTLATVTWTPKTTAGTRGMSPRMGAPQHASQSQRLRARNIQAMTNPGTKRDRTQTAATARTAENAKNRARNETKVDRGPSRAPAHPRQIPKPKNYATNVGKKKCD